MAKAAPTTAAPALIPAATELIPEREDFEQIRTKLSRRIRRQYR